jgi:hypothetical protein
VSFKNQFRRQGHATKSGRQKELGLKCRRNENNIRKNIIED